MNNKYSLLEWNIHKMTNNINVKEYVIKRILKNNPDIIVLVEYKKDVIIENGLQKNYFYKIAIGKNGNDVLIAIKKAIFKDYTEVDFNDRFLKTNLGKNQPSILTATFSTKDNELLTIIGVRYIQGGNGLEVSSNLKQELDKIQHAFICVGDFNVLEHRMPVHFKEYYHETYDNSKEGASIVMLNNFQECIVTGFNRLDHIIYNANANIHVNELNYLWDFTSSSEVYIPYNELTLGDIWKIPAAYPDHAILECKIN